MLRNLYSRKGLPPRPIRSWVNSAGQAHRRHDVDRPLDQPAATAELRRGDLQQRQPGHRPDVDPRSGDIGERRRDEQVDAGVLERPGHPAQRFRADPGRVRDGDGVGVQFLDHLADLGQRRRTGRIGRGARSTRRERADHLQAGVRAGQHPLVQRHRLRALTDQQHPMACGAATAQPVQHPAGGVPLHQGQYPGDRQRDGHHAARHRDVERERQDGDQRGEPHRGVAHPAELLAAQAQEAGLVRARDRHRGRPRHARADHGHAVGDALQRLVDGAEPDQHRDQTACHHGEPVEADQDRHVAALPARGGGGGGTDRHGCGDDGRLDPQGVDRIDVAGRVDDLRRPTAQIARRR
jgi:hypothetical protein